MPKFRVTYQVVTEESAREGDFAEHGYALPGGWKFPLEVVTDPIENYEMSLRDALSISNFSEDCGGDFASMYPDEDYKTGESTFYSLHPPRNITQASYKRLKKVLGAR